MVPACPIDPLPALLIPAASMMQAVSVGPDGPLILDGPVDNSPLANGRRPEHSGSPSARQRGGITLPFGSRE